jgi:hypothetical protein
MSSGLRALAMHLTKVSLGKALVRMSVMLRLNLMTPEAPCLGQVSPFHSSFPQRHRPHHGSLTREIDRGFYRCVLAYLNGPHYVLQGVNKTHHHPFLIIIHLQGANKTHHHPNETAQIPEVILRPEY